MSACPVPRAHVAVALGHCAAYAEVAVLAVHIVHTRPGLIPQPDTKVLDLDGTLFWNFLQLTIVLISKLGVICNSNHTK